MIDRFEFESIYHAQLIIGRYYKWYNEKRRHGSLNRQAPETAWKKYNPGPFENICSVSCLKIRRPAIARI